MWPILHPNFLRCLIFKDPVVVVEKLNYFTVIDINGLKLINLNSCGKDVQKCQLARCLDD
jgi:hypothetical protein